MKADQQEVMADDCFKHILFKYKQCLPNSKQYSAVTHSPISSYSIEAYFALSHAKPSMAVKSLPWLSSSPFTDPEPLSESA